MRRCVPFLRYKVTAKEDLTRDKLKKISEEELAKYDEEMKKRKEEFLKKAKKKPGKEEEEFETYKQK